METNVTVENQIKNLKEKNDIVILAHYYVDGKVQEAADYVGDSYFLSEIATKVKQKNIVFAGVSFMGESAKILNPEKNVYLADRFSDCPMAHMVKIERIREVRELNPDISVVCYVNSTAEIKAESDVCVTSSNALRVIRNLPNKRIFFIPDNNLGKYVANQIPEKEFVFHDGYCHVHTGILKENVLIGKEIHPEALVLAHPECTFDVLEIADFVGSTSEIINYATNSSHDSFIICTEMGIAFELQNKNPNKKFYSVGSHQMCRNMKRITIPKLIQTMDELNYQIELDPELMRKAYLPLARMLELAKQ